MTTESVVEVAEEVEKPVEVVPVVVEEKGGLGGSLDELGEPKHTEEEEDVDVMQYFI